MDAFPEFMKHPSNRIARSNQATPGVEGYVFDGANGSQMAFWTCGENAISAEHVHDYDEYMLVAQGCYTLVISGERISLRPGEEYFIPRGVPHSSVDTALRGADAPKKEIASSIDSLLRHSKVYQYSEQFREMVNFMARFRDYAPYNNMLVRLQNPTCSFYATERDWNERFGRNLKDRDVTPTIMAYNPRMRGSRTTPELC
jgi:quercetin dioxygenase-like cupin family protein